MTKCPIASSRTFFELLNVRYVNEEKCKREREKKRMEERKIITKEEIFWSFLDEEMSVDQCALTGYKNWWQRCLFLDVKCYKKWWCVDHK